MTALAHMTGLAHRPAAFELRGGGMPRTRVRNASQLTLRATEDGWSLLGPEGEVVFRGLGLQGRRQCLEFARDHGVLAVFSGS